MLKTLLEKWLKCRPVRKKNNVVEVLHQRRCLYSRRNKPLSYGLCETWFVERHVSILVKHSKLGAKNVNEVRPKTVQNAPKWPLQLENFQKISGEYARGTSGAFLFFNLLQTNSAE